MTTVRSGEPIKNNSSNVLWSYSVLSKQSGYNEVASADYVESKLTDRFDDPDYYPKQG